MPTKVAGIDCFSVEEAASAGISYCYWKDIWRLNRQVVHGESTDVYSYVIGDDQLVQPVLRFYPSMIMTPSGAYSVKPTERSRLRMWAKPDDRKGRIGGRGSDPPGDGPLTEKHYRFCAKYVQFGFHGEKAFLAIWAYGQNNMRANGRRQLRTLLADPKIQDRIVKLTTDLLNEGGVTEEYLALRLKQFCDKNDKMGFEAVKLAMTAHGMLPASPLARIMLSNKGLPEFPQIEESPATFGVSELGDHLDSEELPRVTGNRKPRNPDEDDE